MMGGAIVPVARANRLYRRGRFYPRGAQVDFVEPRRRRQRQRAAEALRRALAQAALRIVVGAVALVAPSPEFKPFIRQS